MSHQLPVLSVTNPVLLKLYLLGWEDPGWGQTPIGQVALATAVYELGSQIEDVEIRNQLQAISAKSIAKTAEKMASGY